MFRNLALALLVASCSASRAPTVKFNVGHSKLGSAPSPENLSGGCTVETDLTDSLAVGADLGLSLDGANVDGVFARLSQSVMGKDLKARFRANPSDSSFSGEVDFEAGAEVRAYVSSAGGLDKVRLTSRGKGWRVAPTFHAKGFAVDLEAEAALGDDTTASFAVDREGSARVQVTHEFDADTTFKASSSSGLEDVTLSMARSLGAGSTVAPTFTLSDKAVAVDVSHALGGGRTLKASFKHGDPTVRVAMEGSGDEDWSAQLSAPWNAPQDVDVSVGKKFSVASLADLQVPSFGN